MSSSHALFSLDDLENDTTSLSAKSKGTLRSGKKRKVDSASLAKTSLETKKDWRVIDLECNLNSFELLQMLQQRIKFERNVMEDEAHELKERMREAYAECDRLKGETARAKMETERVQAESDRRYNKVVEDAKISATLAIYQSKLQMVKQAGEKGQELWGEQISIWEDMIESLKEKMTPISENPRRSKDVEDVATSSGASKMKKKKSLVLPTTYTSTPKASGSVTLQSTPIGTTVSEVMAAGEAAVAVAAAIEKVGDEGQDDRA